MVSDNTGSLDFWEKAFKQIYFKKNEMEIARPEEYWLHILEKVGVLARDLRKRKYSEIGEHLAHLFAWLCGFTNSQGITLSEAVWNRYPTVCPFCLRGQCECQLPNHNLYKHGALEDLRRKERPVTIEDWVQMFNKIYGPINRAMSREAVVFHLIEEIGEVAFYINTDRVEDYKDEVADVFAWIVAIIMNMGDERGLNNFQETLYLIYRGPAVEGYDYMVRCHRCDRPSCICDRKKRKRDE